MQKSYSQPFSYELSEEDVKLRFITPALERAGWDKHKQIRMEYSFTDGRIFTQGTGYKRGKAKKADYVLSHISNLPLAIVEAKSNTKGLGAGIEQALTYAEILDIPFAYSSNGTGFLEHDRTTGREQELTLAEFPSPQELWERFKAYKELTPQKEEYITQPYYYQVGSKTPRYYQRIAINKTIEAIVNGQKRILLVMATGTGKTYTAFQIIHRFHSQNPTSKILFLADRTALIDQTQRQDFKPFGDKMHKIRDRQIDTAYEIYLALYQQLVNENGNDAYLTISPDFFDLIVIDECHRGSAKDNSEWRKILDYFSSAIQIGMTATPKETEDISNSTYFGEPVYTYSLKQGVEDGFLAPYKVIRIGLDKDLEGWRPEKGQTDVNGVLIEDREYNQKDYDRNIIIDDRTQIVAKRVSEFLKLTNRFHKTIIFCCDTDHAERMRYALCKENADLMAENHRYITQITANNPEGVALLDDFIDEESKYPVIATTSSLLSTGVDCKTCQLIVLDKPINSMTEFKQIIGRGTRVTTKYDKYAFTIMDFRNVTRLFADPEFDGKAEVIIERKNINDPFTADTVEPAFTFFDPDNSPEDDAEPDSTDFFINPEPLEPDAPTKYKPHVRGVEFRILNERVQYLDKDGKLTTESIKDFSKRNILGEYATLDAFITAWNKEARKQAIIEELEEQGVLLDSLRTIANKPNLDDFDLICHIAYDKPPLTRAERANNVRKRGYLHKYSDVALKVIDGLLEKYMHEGILELENLTVLSNDPFRQWGSPQKIASYFGGRDGYLQAVKELQDEIYAA